MQKGEVYLLRHHFEQKSEALVVMVWKASSARLKLQLSSFQSGLFFCSDGAAMARGHKDVRLQGQAKSPH
eukprot:3302525-Amphidinium_carterae.1